MTLRLQIKLVSVMVLLLFSVAIVPSLAQSPQPQPQRVDCANLQTTAAMNVCVGQAYQAADKKLNQVYRQLRAKLSGQQRQRIMYAQLAWIRFRDANCAYAAGQFEGGTMAASESSFCLAKVTQQRARELEEYLQNLNL